MPHIHLEVTPGLAEGERTAEILRALVARLCAFPTIGAHGVKAYTTEHREFALGEGAAPGFVHLTVAILYGRGPDLVREIADGMYVELEAQFAESLASGAAKATMELRQMHADTYRK